MSGHFLTRGKAALIFELKLMHRSQLSPQSAFHSKMTFRKSKRYKIEIKLYLFIFQDIINLDFK